ncbi:MAG: hypothetical protein KA533_07395 [Sphingobium sp.]|nr:hypothetical protein [Sphingobium sp.]MBP6111712.1 hypothetical protein [Sphingobium sp.]MBP8671607.1 hypothetical protein [Sphingobium sp.]MBP9158629.1 hypothetical protein [Sphingobium sp.]MCC6482441.1 hypothetical protein [Sphingomonadaceae bacterium]
MTTTPIANERNSPEGRLIVGLDGVEDTEGRVPAGVFEYFAAGGAADPTGEAGLLFGCPCGCGDLRSVDFDTHEVRSPKWHWDGNRDRPTLTPSILIYQMDETGQIIGEHWHGYLTAGDWKSC